MEKQLINILVLLFLGGFTAFAQIDESDEKDNTLYEMEIDSINQKTISDTTPMDDTTIIDRLDSSRNLESDSLDLDIKKGNDKSIREESIQPKKSSKRKRN